MRQTWSGPRAEPGPGLSIELQGVMRWRLHKIRLQLLWSRAEPYRWACMEAACARHGQGRVQSRVQASPSSCRA